jgi:4,5-DOPA dioxygenase extradiol
VLIIGSGNVVHNLRSLDWDRPELGFDWAMRFGEDATARMLDDPEAVSRLDAHLDYREAAPTPEHFLPLLYVAGLAAAEQESAQLLVDGYVYGGLSMAAYTVGADVRVPPTSGLTRSERPSAQEKPDAPVEDANI